MIENIYEIGFIFRGFTLTSYNFKDMPLEHQGKENKDLRSSFISAINSFAEAAFNNNSLEYLQSGKILFIFKMDKIKSIDKDISEKIILYGLTEKKRHSDRFVRKFLEKVTPILENFKVKYYNKDFSKVSIFRPFREEIKNYFV